MEKKCVDCKRMFRTNITVNGKRLRAHKRIRCFDCKPYGGQAGIHASTMGVTTPMVVSYNINTVPVCQLCGENLPPKSRASNGRKCNSCSNKMRGYFRKRSAIEYKGGKCQDCGCVSNLKEDVAKFDFHHLQDKSFEISKAHSKSWQALKDELDKCVLVCANCHRMRHSSEIPSFIINAIVGRKNPFIGT